MNSPSDDVMNATVSCTPYFNFPSETQTNVQSYLPVVTGSLSLLGSTLTLLSIYRTRFDVARSNQLSSNQRRSSIYRSKAKTSPVYHRILCAMSVYDIVYTLFSSMFGALFNPAYTPALADTPGSRFTCTLQGFFVQWGFGSFAYGAWLSVYYVLTIRYNISEAILVRYVEPVMHFSVFMFYFGTAVIASALGYMNPTNLAVCWIVPYPLYCAYERFHCPCARGANFKDVILWMVLVPSCVSVTVILTCLALVAHCVWKRQTIVRQQRSRLPQPTDRASSVVCLSSNPALEPTPSSREPHSDTPPWLESVTPTPTRIPRPTSTSSVDDLTNEAIAQCIFSGCTFVNSVIWTNVAYGLLISDNFSKGNQYWVRTVRSFISGTCVAHLFG
jgi:hypothetical protein